LNSRTVHALRLAAAATLFSTAGAAIKSCALSGMQVTCLRAGIAGITIAFLMPEARRRFTSVAAATAAAYAACMTLFVLANKLTTSANTIFLQAASPLYLLLLSPWLLKEPVRRRDLGLLGVLALGLALVVAGTEPPSATAPNPRLGNALALLSGVCIAFLVVGIRWLSRRDPGQAAVAVLLGNALAFTLTLAPAIPFGPMRPLDAAIVVYLGVFQIGVAYVFVTRALAHLPALDASMILFLEPVLNPVWTWLVHGEAPGLGAALGGAVILLATAGKTWMDRRS
jgi:drug/metabolite transporter (DMT)-like permease